MVLRTGMPCCVETSLHGGAGHLLATTVGIFRLLVEVLIILVALFGAAFIRQAVLFIAVSLKTATLFDKVLVFHCVLASSEYALASTLKSVCLQRLAFVFRMVPVG